MSDRPIIFSAPMVRALLEGRKTMTRRLAWRSETNLKCMAWYADDERRGPLSKVARGAPVTLGGAWYLRPTFWQNVRPGDQLWVREAFTVRAGYVFYKAGPISPGRSLDEPMMLTCRSPIHMPRKLSRLTLVVTATKIERVQDINEAGALTEGIIKSDRTGQYLPGGCAYAVWAFERLWNDLHGPCSWDANPEVIAITFTVHEVNIDAMGKAA